MRESTESLKNPGFWDPTPSVTPRMMGRKNLQQMNGISRGSSGGGQSSAGMAELGRGRLSSRCHHLCPPLTGQQLPLGVPLAGRHMRGSSGGTVSKETWSSQSGNRGRMARLVPTQPGTQSPLSPGCHQRPQWTALLLLPHLLQLLCFPVLAVVEITWSWAMGLPIHRAGTLLPDQQEHPIDPTGSIPRQTKVKGEEGHPQQAAFSQQQCNSNAVRSPI